MPFKLSETVARGQAVRVDDRSRCRFTGSRGVSRALVSPYE